MKGLELPPTIESMVELAPWTQYGIGGTARYFCAPRSESELIEVLRFRHRADLPSLILGGGTNTLVSDECFDGLVIVTTAGHDSSQFEDGRAEVTAGTSLASLIGPTIRRGWQGLEGFVGIPGTIGGAVWGNAGGVSGGIGTWVEAIRVLEPDGVAHWISGETLPWSYRYSGLGDRAITSVRLRLEPGHDPRSLKKRAREIFQGKRDSQPLSARSAGCVFRNPPGESAGRLIEAAGLKGMAEGGARVSDHHANFIVNEGDATASDVEALIGRVRDRVRQAFGIELEREIVSVQKREGCQR